MDPNQAAPSQAPTPPTQPKVSASVNKKKVVVLSVLLVLSIVLGLYLSNVFASVGLKSPSQPQFLSNLETDGTDLSSLVEIKKIKTPSERVIKYALLRSSTGQELEFIDGEIQISDLEAGDNNFLLVKYYANNKSDLSEGIKIVYNRQQSGCQTITRSIQAELSQDYEVCDGVEQVKGDPYCTNGNTNVNDCSSRDARVIDPNASASGSTEHRDNGNGTYTVVRNNQPVAQYSLDDHKEVIAKCGDSATDFNTLVFIENGKEIPDVDCRDLGQSCIRYTNELDQATATCQ